MIFKKKSMSLRSLLAPWTKEFVPDIPIMGLALHSSDVQPGYVFFAMLGTQKDGRRYIEHAKCLGAVAVVTELTGPIPLNWMGVINIPVFSISGLSRILGSIAACFYEEPSSKFQVTGVTGTNGKTSVVRLLGQAWTFLQFPNATIGTFGFDSSFLQETVGLTTPSSFQLQKYFAACLDHDVQKVAMEASSHALDQGRVQGTHYHAALFTQIGQDHLDYHGTLEAYFQAKRKLFQWPDLVHALYNRDDSAFGFFSQNTSAKHVWTFGKHLDADVRLLAYTETPEGLTLHISSKWGDGEIKTRLHGGVNAYNLIAVLTHLLVEDVSWELAIAALTQLNPIPGRMQYLQKKGFPSVLIDYAHTPDALEAVLKEIRTQFPEKNLWCVFGCGGERDTQKRPLMGKIAERYAHHVILTNDNPRREKPQKIVEDILFGMSEKTKAQILLDRAQAIETALNLALKEDIILIAGKGHETHQDLGAHVFEWNDAVAVQKVWG